MALADADIILGKLALGRSHVTRPDAVRIAQEVERSAQGGRLESFAQAAVRLGFLEPRVIQDLQTVLTTGALICRGTCGESFPLAGMTAQQTVTCRCGGRLFVSREPAPQQAPAHPLAGLEAPPEPSEDGGSQTFMNLEADFAAAEAAHAPPTPAQPAPPPTAPASEEEFDEVAGNTFLDLELELPDDGGGGASAPSAGPVPTVGGDAEGTMVMDSPDSLGLAFEPFSVGPLRVLAPIGRGGMGTVYRAQTRDGKVVALKVMHSEAQLSEEVLARFRREVLLAAALDHPAIVRVHDAGVVPDGLMQGRPYFCMDYIPGRDAAEWQQETDRTARECALLVAQVCDAMEFAHGRGVVHRDLKPGNILVRSGDDFPLVCDFGLARYKVDVQHLTQTGDILGTPSYMPPEQALGQRQKIGPPTDVYALGAIAYFLLTGRAPFTGPSAFSVIEKVVRQAPVPPSEAGAYAPPALEAAIMKALEKEPIDRFPTCSALARALRESVS